MALTNDSQTLFEKNSKNTVIPAPKYPNISVHFPIFFIKTPKDIPANNPAKFIPLRTIPPSDAFPLLNSKKV